MFLIVLTDETYLWWPVELTTVTDGGALLLFRKMPRDPGGPIKRLTRAYSQQAWYTLEETDDWDQTQQRPWLDSYGN